MLDKETLNSLNKDIRDYGTKVKTNTIVQHVSFLKDMGDRFKKIKGGDFDVSILMTMETVTDKIIDDLEDNRHIGKVDDSLEKVLEDLINLNIALVRGAKNGKDDSEDWTGRLRKYIKILTKLTVVALLIVSNEVSEKSKDKAVPKMTILFDWGTKKIESVQ